MGGTSTTHRRMADATKLPLGHVNTRVQSDFFVTNSTSVMTPSPMVAGRKIRRSRDHTIDARLGVSKGVYGRTYNRDILDDLRHRLPQRQRWETLRSGRSNDCISRLDRKL
jgi:hypothetical protein